MTDDKTSVTLNLPYNDAENYWLAVFIPPDSGIAIVQALQADGLQPIASSAYAYCKRVSASWQSAWQQLRLTLLRLAPEDAWHVALIPTEKEPSAQEWVFARQPMLWLDAIAESLWLGSALLQDTLTCYMQPVLDKRGKVFGYEAFARLETESETINGGKIIAASRALGAEAILDRHLHVKAITSFIQSDLEGFLFINFVPGFIRRPEKYLEGLSEAAQRYGMPAKQIVLDFTQSEAPHDLQHFKAIVDYCRSKGYLFSLDDMCSVQIAEKILGSIRPDFIKLDIQLVRGATGSLEQQTIRQLVALSKKSGVSVLAEGVETDDVYQRLLDAGVDLFQGYLFSPPVAVSSLKRKLGS